MPVWHLRGRLPRGMPTVVVGALLRSRGRPDRGCRGGEALPPSGVSRKEPHQQDHLHVGLRDPAVGPTRHAKAAGEFGVCDHLGVEQDERVEEAERPERGVPAARPHPLVLYHPVAGLYHPPLGVPVGADPGAVCGKGDVPLLRAAVAPFFFLLCFLRPVMIMVYSS